MHFQIQYNIIVRTGRRTYPRYFRVEFAFNRAVYRYRPRQVEPAKKQLQAKVIELRSSGWSYPEIAKHLNISVGTAWNMAKLTK
ncbi:MAG: helix-turn-helix domain-containing protein [Anaerolineae bacterium]|nr:helix-turn-helix domain-containing protein [Anaerolineae bacterium]